jgi:hypothetical protein
MRTHITAAVLLATLGLASVSYAGTTSIRLAIPLPIFTCSAPAPVVYCPQPAPVVYQQVAAPAPMAYQQFATPAQVYCVPQPAPVAYYAPAPVVYRPAYAPCFIPGIRLSLAFGFGHGRR